MGAGEEIQVVELEQGPRLDIVEGEGHAHAVIWPGMGAQLRSIHRIDLAPRARTIPLRHPGEAVYYVMGGSGEALDADAGEAQPLRPGSMAHVDPETTYVVVAGGEGMSLVGGPSPPDPALYERIA